MAVYYSICVKVWEKSRQILEEKKNCFHKNLGFCPNFTKKMWKSFYLFIYSLPIVCTEWLKSLFKVVVKKKK